MRNFHPLILVCLELGVSNDFFPYVYDSVDIGLLRMMIFDEIHTYLTEQDFREDVKSLPKLAKAAPKRVALTATLPIQSEWRILDEFYVMGSDTVRASTVRHNIRYEVRVLPGDATNFAGETSKEIDILLNSLLPGEKAIIFPKTTDRCDELAAEPKICRYHRKVPDRMHEFEGWTSDKGPSAIATNSGLGTGLNLKNVVMTIFLNAANITTELAQQSGRGGRFHGERSRSIYLITAANAQRIRMVDTPIVENDALVNFLMNI